MCLAVGIQLELLIFALEEKKKQNFSAESHCFQLLDDMKISGDLGSFYQKCVPTGIALHWSLIGIWHLLSKFQELDQQEKPHQECRAHMT